MNNPELHSLLTDALTTVTCWASPVAGHDFALSSDGLSVAYDTDPDVNGWSGVADTTTADLGCLLTALLSTGAVEHLQQTLRTAITFVEAGRLDDPAVRLGERTAHQVKRIARAVVPQHQRPGQANPLFERYLQAGLPSMPDIDRNFNRGRRDELRDSVTGQFGQPTS